MPEVIWPMQIEVVGLTGEYSSGKTLWGLTIDPQNTCYFDFEKSGGTYSGLGVTRVDIPDLLQKRHPKGYTHRQMFEYWYDAIKKIENGKYSVIFCDPISDIENGLVEWVKARYAEFGFKTPEAFAATGGIFWEKVKSEWKRVLADLSARCQTFVFTAHLKKVWKSGKPTSASIPKGKTTLMELSSLYLYLEREPDAKGSVPQIPGAMVLKSRLAVTKLVDGKAVIRPVLPPYLKQATPDAVRKYIVTPPDYSKLKAGEKIQEKVLSEADKLDAKREIAENQRLAAEAESEVMAKKVMIESARQVAMDKMRPNTDKAQEVRKKTELSNAEQPKSEPEPDAPANAAEKLSCDPEPPAPEKTPAEVAPAAQEPEGKTTDAPAASEPEPDLRGTNIPNQTMDRLIDRADKLGIKKRFLDGLEKAQKAAGLQTWLDLPDEIYYKFERHIVKLEETAKSTS